MSMALKLRGRGRGRRGSALVVALAATTSLLVAGGALIGSVTRSRTASEQRIVSRQASDASDSGAQDGLAKLVATPTWTGSYSLAMGGPVASVDVTAWAHDGADNDGDGATDEADEANYIGITSVGAANCLYDISGNLLDSPTRRAQSTTVAVVQKSSINLAVTQSLYVDDPNCSFKFSGTSFLISGNDTNLDNSAGPNAAIPGIGTVGDPNLIKNQLSKTQKSCVIGSGSNPSVGTVADVDLPATMTSLGSLATKVFNGPDDSWSSTLGDWTNKIAQVTHAKGNLKLNGTVTGFGILVVDGDLDVNGNLSYGGLVYVAGAVRFNGGGSGKNIRGALMTLGSVTGTDVTINGGIDIRYSSQAISLVNTQVSSGITLVSWRRS